jgi:hypothetical protein
MKEYNTYKYTSTFNYDQQILRNTYAEHNTTRNNIWFNEVGIFLEQKFCT